AAVRLRGRALLGAAGMAAARIVGIVVVVAVGSSLVIRPPFVADPNDVRVISQGTLFATAEDEIASVQAGVRGDGRKLLWVTGTAMTYLTIDAKLMPLLPLMARPQSTSVLTIAFGMGSAYREALIDRKSTRLNSSHRTISYAVF